MSDVPSDAPKIAVRGLRKSFGPKLVLDGVDLDCGAGESLVDHRRLGHRQVGADQMHPRPAAARRRLDPDRRRGDRRPAAAPRASALMRKFGMLFQGGALFDSLPRLGERRLRPDPGPRHGARARRATIALREARRGRARPRGRRCCGRPSCRAACRSASALARAIAAEPEIIFFDEPTTGLDPIMADVINDLIVKCVRGARRHGGLDHPRHGQRAQDRRPRSPCCTRAGSSGTGRPPRSTAPATPMSTSSSTAAPKGPIQMQVRAHEPRFSERSR